MKVSSLMTSDVLPASPGTSLDRAMEQMDSAGIRHLPVVDGERVVGILSERDLLEATGWLPPRLRELIQAPTGQVGDFMHSPVVSVSPGDSAVTASLRLIDWSIGCLPVLDDGVLVGMLSDGDVLGAYVSACESGSVAPDSDPRVADVMTRDAVTADHTMGADEALERCRARKIRHLPIMKEGKLAGMVSDRDLRMLVGRGQLEGTPLGELSSDRLATAARDMRVSEAAARLVQNRVGALPVLDGDDLVGLVSSKDVLQHCVSALAD